MNEKILKLVDKHIELAQQFKASSIDRVVQASKIIADSIKSGGCVYICGNGGSAADAQHIAGEIVGRYLKERKGFAAVALGTDTAVMTSIANDYSYENIFARQVEALGKADDVLWAISTSGTSKNVIAAVEQAKKNGMKVVGFAGKSGSLLEKLSDVCLTVEGEKTYEIQQIHQIAYHIICDLVEQSLCTNNP